jgi:hypothetical protein
LFLRVTCFVNNGRESLLWDRFGPFKINLFRFAFWPAALYIFDGE